MAALRVARPAHAPRARHFIPQVLQLAAALLATGNAYERDGSVFFRGIGAVAASGLSRDRALGLAREFGDNPDDPMREDPFDVPVWRPSTARDPAWPSPWGWGRPGWHAECAAMAMAAFGASVDLLVGGQDLTFPHHAYQSAMVQSATSVAPFARRAHARRRRELPGPEDGEIDRQPRAGRRSAAQLPAGRGPAAAAGPPLAAASGNTTRGTSTRRPPIWRPCTPQPGDRTGPRTPSARSPPRCWTIWTYPRRWRSPGTTGDRPRADCCTCWRCPDRTRARG